MSTTAQHDLIVAGRPEAGGADPIDVLYPYTGEVIARVAAATRDEVAHAIGLAEEAFASSRDAPAYRRSALLHAVSRLIGERRETLARDITLETGKAIWESRLECDRAVTTFRLAAEETTRIDGEIVPLDGVPAGEGRIGEVRRFPLGPVAAITPFNSPFNLVAHKVAPALAAGNTVVVKPASATPVSGLNIGALVVEAAAEVGLPEGLISVLPCSAENAEPLVVDPRVKALSFTGSSPVGWALRSRAGQKRVSLELGGNGAVLVHPDAELPFAAQRVSFGGFLLAGQVCASVQRVYVHEAVADRFTELLLEQVAGIRVGDPFDEDTTMGPMLREDAAARAQAWVEEAVAGGARVLAGGTREGTLFQPTVLTGTRPQMRVTCEEIFAPVVVLERYAELDDALVAANATDYGLQAGIFTQDLGVIWKAYRELEVGGVIVNDVNIWRVDSMPYGGVKSSGHGREGVRYAIREQSEEKLLVLNPGAPR
ncbi:MAG TPA: aldehyde dehydrogenase family protein [Gaiellaceae bacterium]|nr:aldehyde dehydrogenase family protein [Gaiellaceae bacterium]